MNTKFDEKNCEDGIRLRSGTIVSLKKSYYDYGDSDSDDNSYDYLCDDSFDDDSLVDPFGGEPPTVDFGFIKNRHVDEFGSFIEPDSHYDSVEGSIKKDIKSKIDVPSGFGETAGKYLEKLNGCYQDCFISHDQLHELVGGFAKYLGWFPENVSDKLVKKYCREAYVHVLWKSFFDEKINDRQFVNLMKRYKKFPKYFRGRHWNQLVVR